MTNHEKFEEMTGVKQSVYEEAIKMLLVQIYGDVEYDLFYENYDNYLNLYKKQIEWLESPVEEIWTYLLLLGIHYYLDYRFLLG